MIRTKMKCPYCTPEKIMTFSGATGHIKHKHPEKVDEWNNKKEQYKKENLIGTTGKPGGYMTKAKKEIEAKKKEETEKKEEKVKVEVEEKPKVEIKEGEKKEEVVEASKKDVDFLDCLDDW